MGCRIISILCFCLYSLTYTGNLWAQDLKILLETDKQLVHPKAIFTVKLSIENISGHRGGILIPYSQNTGKSLFQLKVYQVDITGSYSLVYTSPLNLNMDTISYKASEGFWYLEPNENFSIPFFINDVKNSSKRIESSIVFPELAEGKYALQMIYLPENSKYFKNAFLEKNVLDPIPDDLVDSYPEHFKWEGSFASNFAEIILSKSAHPIMELDKKHCSVCRHIYNENWNRLKNKWDKRSKVKKHPNILWVYGGSQSVLSSLPTYYRYDVILNTKSGIDYISCNYQLGKIFRFRSRVAWLFHVVGFRKAPFRTSKVNWSKLISVKQW
ncbi:MAG: hypothetical protein ACK5D5_06490 [Bacteroidota bacterium]|jgi:hypothetical protein